MATVCMEMAKAIGPMAIIIKIYFLILSFLKKSSRNPPKKNTFKTKNGVFSTLLHIHRRPLLFKLPLVRCINLSSNIPPLIIRLHQRFNSFLNHSRFPLLPHPPPQPHTPNIILIQITTIYHSTFGI